MKTNTRISQDAYISKNTIGFCFAYILQTEIITSIVSDLLSVVFISIILNTVAYYLSFTQQIAGDSKFNCKEIMRNFWVTHSSCSTSLLFAISFVGFIFIDDSTICNCIICSHESRCPEIELVSLTYGVFSTEFFKSK